MRRTDGTDVNGGAAAHDESSASVRSRRWFAVGATLAVLIVGGVVASRTVDLGTSVAALRKADRSLLAIATLAYVASWPLRGRRYGDILAPMDRRLGTGFLTHATLLSQTANLAVPARAGDAVRAVLCKRRRGVPYAAGVASLTVERAFDLLAVAVIGALAATALLFTGRGGPIVERVAEVEVPASAVLVDQRGLLVLGAVVSVGGALAIVRFGRVRGRETGDWMLVAALRDALPASFRRGVPRFAADLTVLARRPRSLAAVGAGSLAVWALDVTTAVLVLAAVTGRPPLALVAVGTLATCVGNLAKVVPLTQGGLGLYEGAFAATVVALSPVAGAVAVAAAVLDHALKNAVTVAGGGVAALALHVSPTLAGLEEPGSDGTDSTLGQPKR